MKPIRVMEMGAGSGGGLGALIPAGFYLHYAFDPDDATCNIQFSSNGTCAISAGASPDPDDWKTGTGVGADYDIRWTNTSGSLSSGTVGTWLSLGSNRVFGVVRTISGTKTCVGTVEIRNATTLAVLATGSITLEATVEV